MHELAIAESAVETILDRTEQRGVTVVRLAVGELSRVVPDTLEFCCELATGGTPLEGAVLAIVEPSGQARCCACDRDFGVEDPRADHVLGCSGWVVGVLDGVEGQLGLVDVDEAERRVNIGMLEATPSAGDWRLIHMGFAVEQVSADQAAEVLSGLEMMGPSS